MWYGPYGLLWVFVCISTLDYLIVTNIYLRRMSVKTKVCDFGAFEYSVP